MKFMVVGWPSLRLDLTEEGIYSISPATRRILSGLDGGQIVVEGGPCRKKKKKARYLCR